MSGVRLGLGSVVVGGRGTETEAVPDGTRFCEDRCVSGLWGSERRYGRE